MPGSALEHLRPKRGNAFLAAIPPRGGLRIVRFNESGNLEFSGICLPNPNSVLLFSILGDPALKGQSEHAS